MHFGEEIRILSNLSVNNIRVFEIEGCDKNRENFSKKQTNPIKVEKYVLVFAFCALMTCKF